MKAFDWTAFDWRGLGLGGGVIDWERAVAALPYAADLAACVQDSVFHGEGDVASHVVAVGRALQDDPEFAGLPPERRNALALAVLWHDVAKPETRTELFDQALGRLRVSHPHHAAKGAVRAWRDLWRAGVPLATRLSVFAMVMGHQRIFRVLDHDDPRLPLARLSALGSLDDLCRLARADDLGRICAAPKIGETLDLIRLAAAEYGCLHGPWPFPNDAARLRFGRGADDALFFEPPPPRGSRLVVLSGLPGSGKDTYFAERLPGYAHVSLDLVRAAMGVAPDDDQGRVAQAAAELCRVHLRAKAPFVFNATNLTRLQRRRIVDLAVAYDAHVEIHALDVAEADLRRANRARREPVPDAVIDRMIAKWEPPTPLEAHAVRWLDRNFAPVPVNRSPDPPGTTPPTP